MSAAEEAGHALQEAFVRADIRGNVGSEGEQIHILTDAGGANEIARCLRALAGAMRLLEEAVDSMRKSPAPSVVGEEEPTFGEVEIGGKPHSVVLTTSWISVLDSEGVCVGSAEFVSPLPLGEEVEK